MRNPLQNERGVALVLSAMMLSAFFALAVVGVDLARLPFTATEVQTVADVAATAGARALLENRSAVAQAQAVVQENTVDSHAASLAPEDLQIGFYDYAKNSFSVGGTPQNAVRATGRVTVHNFLAALLGSPTTTVVRTATAAFSGTGNQFPVLPIVVGDCNFQQFQSSQTCGALPKLKQVPNTTDNSGWTSLGTDSASTSTISKYLPTSCGGQSLPPPNVHVGDFIKVGGGQNDAALKVIDNCVKQGMTQYIIPIVPCGSYNQSMKVLGFATITISTVKAQGSNKGINLSAICNTTSSPGGGGPYGTMTVAMVQ